MSKKKDTIKSIAILILGVLPPLLLIIGYLTGIFSEKIMEGLLAYVIVEIFLIVLFPRDRTELFLLLAIFT